MRHRDHNTMCCVVQCPRCAGRHGIDRCPKVYQDVQCAHCDALGHVSGSCLKRVLGDFRGQAKKGAQPNNKKRERTGDSDRGPNKKPQRRDSYNDRADDYIPQCNHYRRREKCPFRDRCRYRHSGRRDRGDDTEDVLDKRLQRSNNVVVSQMKTALSEQTETHNKQIRNMEEKIRSSHDMVAQLIAQGREAAAQRAAQLQMIQRSEQPPALPAQQQMGPPPPSLKAAQVTHRVHPLRQQRVSSFQ